MTFMRTAGVSPAVAQASRLSDTQRRDAAATAAETAAVRCVLLGIALMIAAGASARELVSIEKCEQSTYPPRDCRLVPLQLAEPETTRFRELIALVERRQAREQAEAKRDGKVTGGVWGFVSYGYRVTFLIDGKTEHAWLHVADGAAWLDGFGHTGNVVFNREESRTVRRIVSRLEATTGTREHREVPPAEIVKRLPPAVTWKAAKELDLNCDLLPDRVFVATDDTHYYVAAVVAPFDERSAASYVALDLAGDSQAALCGDPGELAEEGLDVDIVEMLGDEPEGWRPSDLCKGLRLDSGDCDGVHFYWNSVRQKIAWWRL